MPEELLEILCVVQDVVSPSLPFFLLTALGWGIFPTPVPKPNKERPAKKLPDVPQLDELESELVPLGPAATAQKKKAERVAKTKGKAAGRAALTEAIMPLNNQTNNHAAPQALSSKKH